MKGEHKRHVMFNSMIDADCNIEFRKSMIKPSSIETFSNDIHQRRVMMTSRHSHEQDTLVSDREKERSRQDVRSEIASECVELLFEIGQLSHFYRIA
jgi:hypothetical protein